MKNLFDDPERKVISNDNGKGRGCGWSCEITIEPAN